VQGLGGCVPVCPWGAIDLRRLHERPDTREIDGMLEEAMHEQRTATTARSSRRSVHAEPDPEFCTEEAHTVPEIAQEIAGQPRGHVLGLACALRLIHELGMSLRGSLPGTAVPRRTGMDRTRRSQLYPESAALRRTDIFRPATTAALLRHLPAVRDGASSREDVRYAQLGLREKLLPPRVVVLLRCSECRDRADQGRSASFMAQPGATRSRANDRTHLAYLLARRALPFAVALVATWCLHVFGPPSRGARPLRSSSSFLRTSFTTGVGGHASWSGASSVSLTGQA